MRKVFDFDKVLEGLQSLIKEVPGSWTDLEFNVDDHNGHPLLIVKAVNGEGNMLGATMVEGREV